MNPEEPVTITSEAQITRAYMASPSVVKEITGREDIPPDAFKQEPQGSKLIVLLDRAPDTYGGVLHIPKICKDITPVSVGLVIGVGPQVGSNDPYPGGPICHPSQLLYRHISFSMHIGKPLRFNVMDSKYEAGILILASRDVHIIDWDDDPYAGEQEEFEKFNAEAVKRVEEEAAAEVRLKKERVARLHSLDRG